jgi:hypothetical protein
MPPYLLRANDQPQPALRENPDDKSMSAFDFGLFPNQDSMNNPSPTSQWDCFHSS